MAKIDDLPVELVDLITEYLHRSRDLAALARASHKFHDSVNPLLYKFAKNDIPNTVSWHPLRWAALNGRTGTLKKALAAGIDVNMAFVPASYADFDDWDKFRDREETGGSAPLEAHQEWEPHEDDTDDDDLATSTSTVDPINHRHMLNFPHFPAMDDGEGGWNGVDDFDAMDGFDGAEDNSSVEDDFVTEHDPMSGDDSTSEYEAGVAAAILNHFPNWSAPWSGGEMDEDDEADLDLDADLDSDSDDAVMTPAERRRGIEETFRALHLASRGGHNEVVEILLDHGASIDACSHLLGRRVHFLPRDYPEQYGTSYLPANTGYSPLHLAICYFQESTARLLLSRGAPPRLSEPQRKDAFTALHSAASTGQVDLCKYILDGGFAELDARDDTGLTPFYYAFRSGQWDSTVSYLLEKGADINFLFRQFPRRDWRRPAIQGGEFSTTLYEACAFGCYADAVKLINLGADVNKGFFALDTQHRSPLHALCEPPKLSHEAARHPALSRALASVRNKEGQNVELIKLMLISGADLEAKSRPEEESPLQLAAKHCDVAGLQVLLTKGANVDSQDSEGRIPLLTACGPIFPQDDDVSDLFLRRGSETVAIKMLIDHGSNLNAKDNAGDTALHLACSLSHRLHHVQHGDQKQEGIVRILLQRGAKGGVPNSRGVTPFEIAFCGGLLGVCDTLVRHRYFPCKHEDFDRMVLDLIRERPHHLSALDLLLDLDVNGTLFSKSTYLMKMVDGGDVRMASRYLERCPARVPPLSPKQKLTILQAGLTHNDRALVKQMLATKVSVNSPDKNGHTPLYFVLQSHFPGKEELVRLLLEAGSDIYFKPQSSTIMTPLEKAITLQDHALVVIMLQHQPLRDNPRAPKGVYLHAAARTAPSKRMLSTLIRSGASVTELDRNGDTPLSVFLKSIADQPRWAANPRGASNQICATVWYLWNNKVDVNLRNKSGKAITSYLNALRMYDGDNPARKRIADELQLGVEIVPAKGADEENGPKTLHFRHKLMGLGNFHGGPKPPVRS